VSRALGTHTLPTVSLTEQPCLPDGDSSGLGVNGDAWVDENVLGRNGSRLRHREEGRHG
jgi:hypothetical protein